MTTPAELYRNAVDLNRFSNGVARQIAATYNDAVLEVLNQLAGLDADTAPVKAARLRALFAQLQGSLDNWAGQSTELMIEQMQGLTELQTEFVATELREVLPESAAQQVKSVRVSPEYARSVATTDPMKFNFVALSDDLEAVVTGAPQVAQLTAAKGTSIVLPNGRSLQQSFKVLAQVNVDTFNREVRNGLLIGESPDKIARRLKGRLRQGQTGSVKQLAQKGGQLTARANREVSTLVRTSMNQVANAASQQVYQANQDVTKKYRYIATLDGRTSPICRALDGTEHPYGKGPQPPQHFNCRSTTVPVIDYKGLGLSTPPPGRRKAAQGTVPANQTYGQWLFDQSKADKEKILGGKRRAAYFNKLSRKMGPNEAIRRFVKDDGSEVTLEYLRNEYGDVRIGK